MTVRARQDLGKLLLQSAEQAVAIDAGRLAPARRHRRTVREATVALPPRYRAARIRRLRESLGLSQPLFARALNVSVGTIRSWEQGARVPDGPSRRLLEVVERDPNVILRAVRDGRPRAPFYRRRILSAAMK
ncbi:MAG: helix-turn-helix domain-containing protein [Gemmatimonadetes bacterium]|nr:helix-turn-helix domain-containing protein [Gemmatimonadota bacterium]